MKTGWSSSWWRYVGARVLLSNNQSTCVCVWWGVPPNNHNQRGDSRVGVKNISTRTAVKPQRQRQRRRQLLVPSRDYCRIILLSTRPHPHRHRHQRHETGQTGVSHVSEAEKKKTINNRKMERLFFLQIVKKKEKVEEGGRRTTEARSWVERKLWYSLEMFNIRKKKTEILTRLQASSPSSTKYSTSICSNSLERKMKFLGVISFRNAFPTWAIPNGTWAQK